MEFIFCKTEWKDKDGNTTATHIEIMESGGHAHCRLSFYPRENVQYLSNVFVKEYWRREGICTEMLNAADSHAERPNTIVYVDEWAPEYVRNMYRKRGYVIQQN